MTRLTLPLFAAVALFACSSPAPETDETTAPRPASFEPESVSAESSPLVTELLKARIRTVAAANTGRTDNVKWVELQLRPLVAALSVLQPIRTPEQTNKKLEGPWRALWFNLDVRPFPVDAAHAYQVFTTRGYYYNLFNITLGGHAVAYALKAAYGPIPEGLSFRFMEGGYVDQTLAGLDGIGLVRLAESIEDGTTPLTPVAGSLEDWPAGVTGKLTTLYVDDDLRIAGGELAPSFDGSGHVVLPAQANLLFVLERP
jgi:hypothetical protein